MNKLAIICQATQWHLPNINEAIRNRHRENLLISEGIRVVPQNKNIKEKKWKMIDVVKLEKACG